MLRRMKSCVKSECVYVVPKKTKEVVCLHSVFWIPARKTNVLEEGAYGSFEALNSVLEMTSTSSEIGITRRMYNIYIYVSHGHQCACLNSL